MRFLDEAPPFKNGTRAGGLCINTCVYVYINIYIIHVCMFQAVNLPSPHVGVDWGVVWCWFKVGRGWCRVGSGAGFGVRLGWFRGDLGNGGGQAAWGLERMDGNSYRMYYRKRFAVPASARAAES